MSAFVQLIDQGKVNAKDVASEIGIPPDLLCAKLAVMPAIINFFVIIVLTFSHIKKVICLCCPSCFRLATLSPT